jgi:hypothetical protein
MYSRVVVDHGFDTKTLDKGLKSVWKWEWLEKKVGEELIGRFIRKIKTRVNAYCGVDKRHPLLKFTGSSH